MAEENITAAAKAVSEAMLQVQADLARYGQVTQQTAEQLKDAQMKAKFGVENFTKGTNTAGQALAALAGAGIESTKAMYEGKKGMGAFNSGLDELSKAAALAGTALTLLIPGGFIVKAVVAGLTMVATAAIAYTKAANDMADKLYKGYGDLQESGAAASDGMTGVFNDAKKLGLSMNQLDSMVGLVAANSQELALMSGSVAQGRKEFAKVGEALESSREGFFKMGITQEQQNEALMRYTKNQTLAGRAQNMTTKELADGARAYIYEQDKLAKLTGISAQKQQALLDRARENEQFNAKLRMLELKGDAESLAAAERLKQGLQVAAMAGDESAEAFMASVNGNLRSQAAQKANISTFGEYSRYAQGLLDGSITDAAKGFEKVASAGADYEKTIGVQRSALDSGTDSQFKTSTMQKLALINQMGLDEAQKKIAADQIKQQQGQGDAITDQYGSLIKKQQDVNAKLEKDVFKGIPNAVANMNRLAGVTDTLADGFTILTDGINRLLNILGLGEKKTPEQEKAEKEKKVATYTQDEANWKAASATEKAQSSVARGMERFSRGLGRLTGLKSLERLADTAQQERVASESEYLKKEGKFTQTKTAGGGGGGGGSGMSMKEALGSTSGIGGTSSKDLKAQGLKIKEGDVQAEGKELSPKIIDLAKSIQENIQGFGYFSGFNDKFHNEKASSSKHTKGLAADFTLDKKPSKEQGQELVGWLKQQGASLAIDEYNNPSAKATAGHFHVEIPTFADGGELAAGKLGIAGEAGPEFVQGPATITSSSDIMSAFNNMAMMIGKQTGAIDELIRVAKNGNDIQTKILRIQA